MDPCRTNRWRDSIRGVVHCLHQIYLNGKSVWDLLSIMLVPTVEADTREMMRDHFQTRLPEEKVHRVNDTCYVDTFFSSTPSVRGFSRWNLFCFRRTGLDVAYLMRRRSQSPTTLPRMLAECGAPTVLKSDNAPEFKG